MATLKEIVTKIIAEIEQLSPDQEPLLDPALYLCSVRSLKSLNILLKFYVDDEREATPETLAAIAGFLNEYSLKVFRTDAIFPHSPHLTINKARKVIVSQIASILRAHYFDLLM